MADLSPTYRLLDIILDGSLVEFVASRREDGRSWRLISRDLWEATEVDVSFETLRSWFPDDDGDNGDEEAA